MNNPTTFEESYLEANGLPSNELLALALREGNSKPPIYQMHKWWARRLSSVFRAILLGYSVAPGTSEQEFLQHFSGESQVGEGRIVYDPFVGGGTTLVEAQRLGFKIAGCEIDPVAWFLTLQELQYGELVALDAAYAEVRSRAEHPISRLYQTRLADGTEADFVYGFWVSLLPCAECGAEIELHPNFHLHRNRKASIKTVFCSKCHDVQSVPIGTRYVTCVSKSCGAVTEVDNGNLTRNSITCPECGRKSDRKSLQRKEPLERRLFAVEYLDRKQGRKAKTEFKRASHEDCALVDQAQELWESRSDAIPWMKSFLQADIPTIGRKDPRPTNFGFPKYSHLFNARQLVSLSYIGEAVEALSDSPTKDLLRLALSDSLAANNMLCCYAFDYKKLTPLFGLHGYRLITRPVENNVWGTLRGRGSFTSCFRKVRRGMSSKQSQDGRSFHCPIGSDATGQFRYNSSSYTRNLQRRDSRDSELPSESIDLVVTDPPYFDNIQYGELSDFYYQWLRPLLKDQFPDEMLPENTIRIAGEINGSDAGLSSCDEFSDKLYEVFKDCQRVLKNHGMLIFTFHYKNSDAWAAVGKAISKSGFAVTNVIPVRSEGRSGFHSDPGNLKWDAILVCRKASCFVSRDVPSYDSEITLREWHEKLDGLDGEPSPTDWSNLRHALETANSVNSCLQPGTLCAGVETGQADAPSGSLTTRKESQ